MVWNVFAMVALREFLDAVEGAEVLIDRYALRVRQEDVDIAEIFHGPYIDVRVGEVDLVAEELLEPEFERNAQHFGEPHVTRLIELA